MLSKYIKANFKMSLPASWESANNLCGAVFVGAAMILAGVIHFFDGDGGWRAIANASITLIIYTMAAWGVIFAFRFLFISPYKLWREEGLKNEAENKEKSANQTNFKAQIESVIVGNQSDDPIKMGMFINISIKNSGVPSIADYWEVWLIHKDNRQECVKAYIPPSTTLNFNDMAIEISNHDAIYEKAFTPVPTGGKISGWLYVLVPSGMRQEDIFSTDTQIEVKFKDIEEFGYTAHHLCGGNRMDRPTYIPGSAMRITSNVTR